MTRGCCWAALAGGVASKEANKAAVVAANDRLIGEVSSSLPSLLSSLSSCFCGSTNIRGGNLRELLAVHDASPVACVLLVATKHDGGGSAQDDRGRANGARKEMVASLILLRNIKRKPLQRTNLNGTPTLDRTRRRPPPPPPRQAPATSKRRPRGVRRRGEIARCCAASWRRSPASSQCLLDTITCDCGTWETWQDAEPSASARFHSIN